MQNNFLNLRDQLLKDRPGEEVGYRAETIITLSLALLATLSGLFLYKHPVIIAASVFTNAVAVFCLYQAIRGRYSYLILFPTVTSISLCLTTILDGQGVHDLLWIGNLGFFLLANVYGRNNHWPAILLGTLMVFLFVTSGVAEVNNILPNPFGTTLKYVFVNTFFFILIMSAILAVFQRQRALLASSIKNEQAQAITNQRLEESNRTLESQVAARTIDLSKLNDQLNTKAARLQAVSEISQELMAHIEEKSDDLLTRAAKLISQKLDFYHVGIFLIDGSREYAILHATNSKGGQQMLARRHQLKVGGTGIVGYVALTGRPRIALDTSADVIFFNNPDLPETRSEISLPLKYGNKVIGVLDVQSLLPSAFTNDDADTLSALANQLAIVVQNTQILDENRYSSPRNAQFVQKGKESGFSFKPDGSIAVSSGLPEKNPALKRALASGETIIMNQPPKGTSPTLAVPVKLRDRVIGIIHIEASQGNRAWTDDEVSLVQAVSDRAALALDNARLLEESQKRAAKEHVIGEISQKIGAGTDVETILRTAVRELGSQIRGAQVTVEIGGGNS